MSPWETSAQEIENDWMWPAKNWDAYNKRRGAGGDEGLTQNEVFIITLRNSTTASHIDKFMTHDEKQVFQEQKRKGLTPHYQNLRESCRTDNAVPQDDGKGQRSKGRQAETEETGIRRRSAEGRTENGKGTTAPT